MKLNPRILWNKILRDVINDDVKEKVNRNIDDPHSQTYAYFADFLSKS